MDIIKELLASMELYHIVLLLLAIMVAGAIVTAFILHRATKDDDQNTKPPR